MKEDSITRLIQSFVISQIPYIAAFHNWFSAEKTKINNLIKKMYKVALGIPIKHESLFKVRTSQHTGGIHRSTTNISGGTTTRTTTGWNIPRKLGMNYHNQYGEKRTITREIHEKLLVANIPKNMHPGYNKGRRTSRAEKMIQLYGVRQQSRLR